MLNEINEVIDRYLNAVCGEKVLFVADKQKFLPKNLIKPKYLYRWNAIKALRLYEN